MTTDQDPLLHSLFAIAEQDMSGEPFTTEVMSQIDRQRRSAIIVWICVGLVLLACLWLISAPLLNAINLATQVLPRSLVELDDRWLARILSPVNSIGAVVAFGFLGLRMAYRKIFS